MPTELTKDNLIELCEELNEKISKYDTDSLDPFPIFNYIEHFLEYFKLLNTKISVFELERIYRADLEFMVKYTLSERTNDVALNAMMERGIRDCKVNVSIIYDKWRNLTI